jgi:3-deoxy-manno-octulosonate cytidylyltransferase (CMP-KDO synthetase)
MTSSQANTEPPIIVVIPARLASTRLPRKPLADIGGAPMIVRVAQQAQKSAAARVIVATDSEEVLVVCQQYHIEALKTRPTHLTGTDRLSEVVEILQLPDDAMLVNVQGDEPFIPPELINLVAKTLHDSPSAAIATVGVPLSHKADIQNPNIVKIVRNHLGQALYFSRAPIPYLRDPGSAVNPLQRAEPCLRHIGLYAYQSHFLRAFINLLPAPIELAESLEQLRALWYGYQIQIGDSHEAPPAGVDTPEDLYRAQQQWDELHPKSS